MKRIAIAAGLGGVIFSSGARCPTWVLQGDHGNVSTSRRGAGDEALRAHVPEAGMYMYPVGRRAAKSPSGRRPG
jgi:hypothetical protein